MEIIFDILFELALEKTGLTPEEVIDMEGTL